MCRMPNIVELNYLRLQMVADAAQLAGLERNPKSYGQSQHAGALFTLAEAASGAAMVSLFADKVLMVQSRDN